MFKTQIAEEGLLRFPPFLYTIAHSKAYVGEGFRQEERLGEIRRGWRLAMCYGELQHSVFHRIPPEINSWKRR